MGEITAYQGEWPLRVIPAKPSTACESNGGVLLTVYASVHGKPSDAFEIQIPMSADYARQLAQDLQASAIAADFQRR
jgi:hypothetical protein